MATIVLSRDQLIGCWKVVAPTGIYVELREDGTARRKESWKGASGDVACRILWRHIEPDGLELVYYPEGGNDPIAVHEYRAKYFQGKRLEWWHIRINDSVVTNIMLTEPVCWMRTRPPKSWENEE